ncbi:hypothetical protein U1Q18_002100, partial [Sarracenia purpurea var. burkii]
PWGLFNCGGLFEQWGLIGAVGPVCICGSVGPLCIWGKVGNGQDRYHPHAEDNSGSKRPVIVIAKEVDDRWLEDNVVGLVKENPLLLWYPLGVALLVALLGCLCCSWPLADLDGWLDLCMLSTARHASGGGVGLVPIACYATGLGYNGL